jgi:hypothetical protein
MPRDDDYRRHDDDEPVTPTISAAEARALLPAVSFDDFVAHSSYEPDIQELMYVHYLVARGNIDDLINYLSPLSLERQHALVDGTDYATYWGNTLHACAYWNTGYESLVMYRYLVSLGAKPRHDYYEQMPWEVNGVLYVCPMRGRDIAEGYHRDLTEFDAGHAMIQAHFGSPCVVHGCQTCASSASSASSAS